MDLKRKGKEKEIGKEITQKAVPTENIGM